MCYLILPLYCLSSPVKTRKLSLFPTGHARVGGGSDGVVAETKKRTQRTLCNVFLHNRTLSHITDAEADLLDAREKRWQKNVS